VERAYAAWRAFQDRLLAQAAALVLLGTTLLALLEVVRRYVFGVSFDWYQDAATFFTLAGVFLYFSISQRHNEHLTVTVVPEVLQALGPGGARAAEALRLLARGFSLAFMLAVCWWGIPEVREALHYETRTESLAFPMWPFLAALLAGFGFMAVTLAFQLWFGIRRFLGQTVPEDEAHPPATAD
jgi:TRAP-type C4-dicarboxylate transport system permease small subunit